MLNGALSTYLENLVINAPKLTPGKLEIRTASQEKRWQESAEGHSPICKFDYELEAINSPSLENRTSRGRSLSDSADGHTDEKTASPIFNLELDSSDRNPSPTLQRTPPSSDSELHGYIVERKRSMSEVGRREAGRSEVVEKSPPQTIPEPTLKKSKSVANKMAKINGWDTALRTSGGSPKALND